MIRESLIPWTLQIGLLVLLRRLGSPGIGEAALVFGRLGSLAMDEN